MEFHEVYCMNCEKVLGRYNSKFYNEEKIQELLKTDHVTHIRSGHQVFIRNLEKN